MSPLGSSRSLGVTSPLPRADGARERGILSVGNYDVDVLGRNVVLPPAVEKVAACNQVLLKALFVVAHRQRNRFAFGLVCNRPVLPDTRKGPHRPRPRT